MASRQTSVGPCCVLPVGDGAQQGTGSRPAKPDEHRRLIQPGRVAPQSGRPDRLPRPGHVVPPAGWYVHVAVRRLGHQWRGEQRVTQQPLVVDVVAGGVTCWSVASALRFRLKQVLEQGGGHPAAEPWRAPPLPDD
jgi:hypothetical protein